MQVKNIKQLQTQLKKLEDKYQKGPEQVGAIVGFTQSYAIYVHERPAAHKVGRAKFLETAYRDLKFTFKKMLKKALKGGADLQQGLLLIGLAVQRAAQQLTPIDTGALKASAFTSTLQDVNTIAQQAFERSETIRKAKLASRTKKTQKRKMKRLKKRLIKKFGRPKKK